MHINDHDNAKCFEMKETQCTTEIYNPAAAAKSLQSCPTLCDPIDGSPPGSSVPEILQARILEWVAMPPSRDLPNPGIKPRSPTLQEDSSPSEPPGKSCLPIIECF